MAKLRILLADDHVLFRNGLSHLLSSHSDIEIVAEASDGAEAVAKTAEVKPDLVLLDISMPGMPAFEAARTIKRDSPAAKILFVTMYDDEDYLVESMSSGANGYVLKDTPAPQFLAAIREVGKGGSYLSSRMLSQLVQDFRVRPQAGMHQPRHATLTSREREVLKMVAEGKSVKEIATGFSLSAKTIEAHKFNLMRKLGLHNKAQLVQYAVQHKVIKLHQDASSTVPY